MPRLMMMGFGGPLSQPVLTPPTANLRLWLKADALSLANGADVTSWTDSSGNNFHVPALAARPTFVTSGINGKPSIAFNGSSQAFGGATVATPLFSDLAGTGNTFEIAVVFNATSVAPDTTTSAWNRVGVVAESSGSVGLMLARTTGGQGVATGYLYPGTYPDTNFTIGSATRITGWRDTSDNKFYVKNGDGSSVFQVLSSDTIPISRIYIGRNYTQVAWFSGQIAEILIWSVTLSNADRTQARDYLFGKYGV